MSGLKWGEFRQVFRSGGLRRVGVTGGGSSFCITGVAKTGEIVVVMSARPGRARLYRTAAPALALLYRIGVRKVEVDMSCWSPDGNSPPRPDVSARMTRLHRVAAMVGEMGDKPDRKFIIP